MHILFHTKISVIQRALYLFSTSQFTPATSQVPASHAELVVLALDSRGLERSLPSTTSVPCPLAWDFQKCKRLVLALRTDSSIYISPGALEELLCHRWWHTSQGTLEPLAVLPARVDSHSSD